MSVQQALEARIRANLEDRDAWRVYGDWLLEHGEVRGELIGLEHRLEAAGLSDEEQKATRARVQALVAEHWPDWLAGLELPEGGELQWRHGFVVGAALRWDPLALDALRRIRAHPAAALLSSLDLSGTSDDAPDNDHVRTLAASEHLRSLTALRLSDNVIGARGAEALAGSEHLRSLTALCLSDNEIALVPVDERRVELHVHGWVE